MPTGQISELQTPPEFAQPRLSRVKTAVVPSEGTNLCVFVPIWPVITLAGVVTGHIGTNTHTHKKTCTPRWGRPLFDPTQTGLCEFGWVWSSLIKRFLPITRVARKHTLFARAFTVLSQEENSANSDLPPTPWSGPFRDHGLRPWSQSPSERCKPYA